jgi:hypothetical protein
MRIGKLIQFTSAILVILFGTAGHAIAGKLVDAYYLVTGNKLSCDSIYSNICIAGRTKVSNAELEKIIAFSNQYKHHPSLRIFQIKFEDKEEKFDIRVIACDFDYDFKLKTGHGSEQHIIIKYKGSGLALVDQYVTLHDP